MSFYSMSVFFLYAVCLSFGGVIQQNTPRYLNLTVLDGRNDCGIIMEEKTQTFFKAHRCQKILPPFDEDFFSQAEFLPCIGIYDALYNLCEFDLHDVDFNIPNDFNDSKTFCESAAKVYSNINFNHSGHEISKWTSALKSSMVKNETCNHLCVLENQINSLCLNMVVAANEYLRLNGLKYHKNITASETNLLASDKNVNILDEKKPILEGDSVLSMNDQGKDINVTLNQAPILSNLQPTTESKTVAKISSDTNNKIALVPTSSTDTPQPISEISNAQIIEKEEGLEDDQETINDSPITNKKATEQKIASTDEDDNPSLGQLNEAPEAEKKQSEDIQQSEIFGSNYVANKAYESTEDSLSFSYSATVVVICFVLLYFLFHYKNKLFALAIEGRKGRSHRGRGRPSSANYSKLHSNLEEAIASNVTSPSATHVLY